jgi:hypothetical protein
MKAFAERDAVLLNGEQRAQAALRIARVMESSGDKVNRNKMKRLSAQVGGSADKWEALTALARYYPLTGVPEAAVDELVALLEEVDLYTFKEVTAQAMIFFEASEKGWEGLKL